MPWTLIMPDAEDAHHAIRSLPGVGRNPTTWAETLFEPNDILEIRALPPKQLRNEKRPYQFISSFFNRCHRVRCWIRASDFDGMVIKLHELNHIDGVTTPWGRYDREKKQWETVHWIRDVQMNIHCSANPRTDFGGACGDDVALARSLLADFDYISAATAAATIEESGVPPPTMVLDSGHGAHAYWRLHEPITDLAVWTNLQKRLIKAVGSDPAVHDPARMMRVPGFQNVNWTPKLCAIVSLDLGNCYELSEIQASLPATRAGKPAKPRPQNQANNNNGEPKVTISRDQSSTLERAFAYQATFKPTKEGARNAKLFDLCANVVEKFTLDVDDVVKVANVYNQRLESPLNELEVQQVAENAYRHILKKEKVDGLPPERRETLPKPRSQEVALSTWRAEMRKARLQSLKQLGTINFDGSAAGSGKSTADFAAMQKAKSSITFVPTHKACAELALELNNNNLSAAAFPAINESTCQRYGTRRNPGEAQVIQRAGLEVGKTLCPGCYHFKTCDYQEKRETARTSPHAVATHARASHSVFAPAEDRDVVFIHEDARTLLRPMVAITSRRTNQQPSIRDLKDVFEVARKARDIADDCGDEEKRAFAVSVAKMAKRLMKELEDRERVEAVKLSQESNSDDQTLRAKSLELPAKQSIPDGCDILFHRAMKQSVINLKGEALRLVISAGSGQLESLCVVIDDHFSKQNGNPVREFYKSLVGVWKIEPPTDAVVWFEDATGDIDLLRNLLRRPVFDGTPAGTLCYEVPPVQIPIDIKMSTSANSIRGLIRGVLTKWSDKNSVGIITHQIHISEVEKVEQIWRKKIKRIDYFHSGNDRASNNWLDCDLLLILGTPRVPPAAIRHTLIQIGRIEAAAVDGDWANRQRKGTTVSGNESLITNPSYSHPDWQKVHQMLVKNTMLQAIGRGRGIMKAGVPVVVFSTEKLSIPLAEHNVKVIKDSEARTLQAIHAIAEQKLTEENSKHNILGEISVSTAEIASCTKTTSRQTLTHCHTLSNLRLLSRKGERGGWMVAGAI